MYFHYFLIISPWKCVAPSFNRSESPLPKDALCQVWLKLSHWFWRRRRNVYDDNDNRKIAIKKLTIAFCSGELKMITETSISKQNNCSYRGSIIEESYQFTYSYIFHCIHKNHHEMTSYWSIENMMLIRRSNMEFSMDQQPEHQDCWTFLVLNYLENNV